MHKLEFKRTPAALLACSVLALSSMAYAGVAMATGQTSETAATQTTPDSTKRADNKKAFREDGRHRYRHGHKFAHRHAHHMANAAMILPGYGPIPEDVVSSLSLNAQQQELVDDAKAFFKDQHEARRDKIRDARSSGKDQSLSSLDPHARVKLRAERMAAMQQVYAEGTDKWLAVWDSLDAAQKDTLTEYVAKRHEERVKRREQWREKRAARQAEKRADNS